MLLWLNNAHPGEGSVLIRLLFTTFGSLGVSLGIKKKKTAKCKISFPRILCNNEFSQVIDFPRLDTFP